MRSSAACLLFALVASADAAPGPAQPAKGGGSKSGTIQIETDMAGDNFKMALSGAADLPDGTVLRIRCDPTEHGRKLPEGGWQIFAEVRGGRFDVRWMCARTAFRPGVYAVEATPREDQRGDVGVQLTKEQKAFKLTGTLSSGGAQPGGEPAKEQKGVKAAETPESVGGLSGVELAVDACRPIASGLRKLAAASAEFAKHSAQAAEGKLTKPVWTGWKGKSGIGTALADLEKTLARKDVPYYFHSAASLSEVVERVRKAVAACDAAVEGTAAADAKAALESAFLPGDEEATRLLRPLYLDGLGMFVTALDEILTCYGPPISLEKRARGKPLLEQYVKAWLAFKGLPWKGVYPIQFQLMDDILGGVKSLPSAPFTLPAPPKPEAPDAAGAKGKPPKAPPPPKPVEKPKPGEKVEDPVEVVVQQVRSWLATFRNTLAAEKAKK